ncbi:hypothetical protein [Rickettsia honei]|uniref:hypothetical protein n=1 Tax=Rickettsia honei TaxID=37816 RepID=UPI000307BF0C|nr:hypothetical protein [Rickettsia honei]
MFRGNHIRIFGAGYWRKGKRIYEQEIKYTDKDDSVKVTISLSKESVEFFKSEAATAHVPYQKMIRILLDKYTKHYNANKRV